MIKDISMPIEGRFKERKILQRILDSKESEFIAIYGRRRVGKTYLIRSFFEDKDCIFFQVSGIYRGRMKTQLSAFDQEIYSVFFKAQAAVLQVKPSNNWMDALDLLTKSINEYAQQHKKVVLFFDEFPWMATKQSGLLQAIDYYWNRFWVQDKRIKLIICGSSASWIIKKILKNKNGLHNRVTQRIKMEPFSLQETKLYLIHKGIKLDNFQILQIYMCLGGVPFYLKFIEKGLTAIQNINQICFQKEGALFDEFDSLFSSLFEKSKNHEEIVKLISIHRQGLTRKEIEKSLYTKGGRLTIWLKELEEAGFIASFYPHDKEKGIYYKIVDEYTLFYLTWIRPPRKQQTLKVFTEHYWQQISASSEGKAWLGYAFEAVCFKHLDVIRRVLNIPEGSQIAPWKYIPLPRSKEQGAEIDLLFERPDQAINLCEIKFCAMPYLIDKSYAKNLLQKIEVYKNITKTVKQIFLSMITSCRLATSLYSKELVSNEVVLEDFFESE